MTANNPLRNAVRIILRTSTMASRTGSPDQRSETVPTATALAYSPTSGGRMAGRWLRTSARTGPGACSIC